MAFKYKVGSVDGDARAAASIIAPGRYEFELKQFSKDRKKSEGGADMVGIFLAILDKNGAPLGHVWDNLVFSDAAFWRIERFLKSIQMGADGDEVDFSVECEDQFIGARGICELKIVKIAKGPNAGQDKTDVADYLADWEEKPKATDTPAARPNRGAPRGPTAAPAAAKPGTPAPADDDIPY